jgi:hypothetical protein
VLDISRSRVHSPAAAAASASAAAGYGGRAVDDDVGAGGRGRRRRGGGVVHVLERVFELAKRHLWGGGRVCECVSEWVSEWEREREREGEGEGEGERERERERERDQTSRIWALDTGGTDYDWRYGLWLAMMATKRTVPMTTMILTMCW